MNVLTELSRMYLQSCHECAYRVVTNVLTELCHECAYRVVS